jgi:hypothetical protein
MTGAEGWVIYGADDSSLLFSVGWDNPYIGANSGSARLGFSKAGQYMVRFFVGNGPASTCCIINGKSASSDLS